MNSNDYIIAVLLSGIFVMTGCILYLAVSIANHVRRTEARVAAIYSDFKALQAEAERRYTRRG